MFTLRAHSTDCASLKNMKNDQYPFIQNYQGSICALWTFSAVNNTDSHWKHLIEKYEEIYLKYGWKYFGDYNVDCLCRHVEFLGAGFTT